MSDTKTPRLRALVGLSINPFKDFKQYGVEKIGDVSAHEAFEVSFFLYKAFNTQSAALHSPEQRTIKLLERVKDRFTYSSDKAKMVDGRNVLSGGSLNRVIIHGSIYVTASDVDQTARLFSNLHTAFEVTAALRRWKLKTSETELAEAVLRGAYGYKREETTPVIRGGEGEIWHALSSVNMLVRGSTLRVVPERIPPGDNVVKLFPGGFD